MDEPDEHRDVRQLFAAIVATQPTSSETTSAAVRQGRRIRRRRRVAAAAGGVGLVAAVALSANALQDRDLVMTETPQVAERPATAAPSVPSVPSRGPTATSPTGTRSPGATPLPSKGSSRAPSPGTSVSGADALDPARPVYCGSVVAVDTARARLTFHATMSYRVAGDIHDARPENITVRLAFSEDPVVREFTLPKGTDREWEGPLADRLLEVKRLARGDKKPYVTVEDGKVARISFGLNNGNPTMPTCTDSR
jgi:hypothetical protein